jgi:polysaccharide biosynthesis transport protein
MHNTVRGSFANAPQDPTASAVGLDLGALFAYLWGKKWIFINAGLISGTFGVILAFVTLPKMYSATATVMVEDSPPITQDQNAQMMRDLYAAPEALKAVEGAFNTDTLLLELVKENHLDKTNAAFQSQPGRPAVTDADLVDIMSKRYSAKMQRASRLIDITVDDEDPHQAAKLAQSAVDIYERLSHQQGANEQRLANDQLLQQADDVRQKLQSVQEKLQTYRQQYNTISIEEKRDISTDQLRQLNQQLTDAKGTRIRLQSDLGGLTDVDHTPLATLLAVPSLATQQDVADLQRLLANAGAQLAQVQSNYGTRHPQYAVAKSQVDSVRTNLDRVVRDHARALVNSFRSAQQSEKALGAELADQERQAVTLSGISIPYSVLEREFQADQSMYDQILQRIKENSVQQSVGRTNVKQVQTPVPPNPETPSKPKTLLVLAITIVGGLGTAFLFVLGKRAMDSSFHTVDEAQSYMPVPLLTAIPVNKGKKEEAQWRKSRLVQAHLPGSPQAEAFRAMRATLALTPDGSPRITMVTSSIPREGKSFCAANYAISLAQQGLKTMLIGADLRRPALIQLFTEFKDSKGMSDYLSEDATFAEVCNKTQIDNLYLIRGGKARSRPAELLGNTARVKELLGQLADFDRIVIDSAPVLAVSDALLLVPLIDSVVFVVRAQYTQQKEISRSLQLLEQAGANIVGFALNFAPKEQAYRFSKYIDAYQPAAAD